VRLAATTEALSASLYTAVLRNATFDIGVSAAETLHQVLATRTEHLREIAQLGGVPSVSTFYVSPQVQSDARQFVATAEHLSHLGVQMYVSATEAFAAQGEPASAAVTARLAASEARHGVMLAHLAGLNPGSGLSQVKMVQRPAILIAELAPYLQAGTSTSLQLRFGAA